MLKFKPRAGGRTKGAQTINRAAAVLRFVSSRGEAGIALKDVSAGSGLCRATTHRILSALVDEGLLEYNRSRRSYRLGAEIFALSAAMGDRFDIKKLAEQSLDRLSQSTKDSVYVAIRSCYDGLCLDLREGDYPSRLLRLHIHDRWPMGVGAFTIPLLAFLPDSEASEIIERNAPRLAGLPDHDPDRLHQVVAETRERGYAVNYIRAYPGFCGVGIPIFDSNHRPIASLCVAGLVSRFTADKQAAVAADLWAESIKISAAWQRVRMVGSRPENWRLENDSSRMSGQRTVQRNA
jgi:DNA-binding IclR family transcriptional regulator